MTGVVHHPLFFEHGIPGHPEGSARLESITAELSRAALWERLTSITPRPVDLELLGRVHDPAYIRQVAVISRRGGGYLDSDTYLVGATYDAALLAAGGAAELTREVLRGEIRNGIGLLRPPGHHAVRGRGMGFCIFNNIAVAAQVGARRPRASAYPHLRLGRPPRQRHAGHLLRVAGCAVRVYPPVSPLPRDGRLCARSGRAPGTGYTVNMPLPVGVGDQGFERLFREIVTPVAERFGPDLILVSAGYDAHWRDPLAGLHLSLGGYWRLAQEAGGAGGTTVRRAARRAAGRRVRPPGAVARRSRHMPGAARRRRAGQRSDRAVEVGRSPRSNG